METARTRFQLKQGLRCWIEDRFIVRPDRLAPSNYVSVTDPDRWLSFGIIGSGFLRRHRAVMDYASEYLFLDLAPERRPHETGVSRKAMQQEGYTAIPMQWDDKTRQWTLSGKLNDAPLTFQLDTGTNVTCVDRPLASKISFSDRETETGLTGEAHQKGAKAGRVRVTELRLGDFLTQVTHVYLTPVGGHNSPGCLIGADTLVMHRAVLDFGENMLYLRCASVKAEYRQQTDSLAYLAEHHLIRTGQQIAGLNRMG